MKRWLSVLLTFVLLLVSQAVQADGQRIYQSPFYPARKIVKQFNTNADNFCTTDPTPDGTPLTLANATGKSTQTGTVTINLTDGFTAPVTLTIFYWNRDKAAWVRLGPDSASYSKSFDAHYTVGQFNVPENTDFLIQSSASITGGVYLSGTHSAGNNNSAAGYDQ